MTLAKIKKIANFCIAYNVTYAYSDSVTRDYIKACMKNFNDGYYGIISDEDRASNKEALKQDKGFIYGRYPQAHKLKEDIIIYAIFDDTKTGHERYKANKKRLLYISDATKIMLDRY